MQADPRAKREATTPPQQHKKSRTFKLFRESLGQWQNIEGPVPSAPKRFVLVIQKDHIETQILRIGEDYFWAKILRLGKDKLL